MGKIKFLSIHDCEQTMNNVWKCLRAGEVTDRNVWDIFRFKLCVVTVCYIRLDGTTWSNGVNGAGRHHWHWELPWEGGWAAEEPGERRQGL